MSFGRLIACLAAALLLNCVVMSKARYDFNIQCARVYGTIDCWKSEDKEEKWRGQLERREITPYEYGELIRTQRELDRMNLRINENDGNLK